MGSTDTKTMAAGYQAQDRTLLRVGGKDAKSFLQGLITNDMDGVDTEGSILYAALLSPQGKYLFDFFVVRDSDAWLLDVKSNHAPSLLQRLSMYRLRAEVDLAPFDASVVVGMGSVPEGALPDPRDERLGWRLYTNDPGPLLSGIDHLDPAAHEASRIELGIPATDAELLTGDSFILEMDFERLNGVDFRKGCYVGQEVTARMKHKTTLRKGLARVNVSGPAPEPGTEITAGGKTAGTLHSVADGKGLAYLRFDRATGRMMAGSAEITLLEE